MSMKMDDKLAEYKMLTLLCSAVIVTFLFTFCYIYPVDYSNLGGQDIWLSGSTIKFVNMWLEEGAATNRFTCYESFDSIEFNSLNDRTPYLSYPTGSVFMVFAAAKCMGKKHIDISFLKHYQMCLFAAEVLFLALFLYWWCSNTGVFSKRIKVFISFTLSVMWMLLPGSVYYLSNVFYADQAVIFWFMFFLLIEYESNQDSIDRGPYLALNLIKLAVIYLGVLTDYFFWILVFFAFLFRFIKDLFRKSGIWNSIKHAAWYICPVFLALGTYIWQMSYTENWTVTLFDKFLVRTSSQEGGGTFRWLMHYFADLYLMDNSTRLNLLLAATAVVVAGGIYYLLKNRKYQNIFIDNNISIVLTGILATFLQVIVLKNHSESHQFSMLKMGWVIIIVVLLGSVIWAKCGRMGTETKWKFFKYKISALWGKYIIVFALINLITGSLLSTNTFVEKAVFKNTYELEEVLYNISEYRQVFFCFTYTIPTIPPYQLAVSQKQVYQIESLSEIDEMFPKLSEDAQKILIIDKLWAPKAEEIADLEEEVLAYNKIVYEDEVYCMVELENY